MAISLCRSVSNLCITKYFHLRVRRLVLHRTLRSEVVSKSRVGKTNLLRNSRKLFSCVHALPPSSWTRILGHLKLWRNIVHHVYFLPQTLSMRSWAQHGYAQRQGKGTVSANTWIKFKNNRHAIELHIQTAAHWCAQFSASGRLNLPVLLSGESYSTCTWLIGQNLQGWLSA
jgi:hypothetical protein